MNVVLTLTSDGHEELGQKVVEVVESVVLSLSPEQLARLGKWTLCAHIGEQLAILEPLNTQHISAAAHAAWTVSVAGQEIGYVLLAQEG